MKKNGVDLCVYSASTVTPLDEKMLREAAERRMPLFTAEENVLAGGFGSAVAEWCLGGRGELRKAFALPNAFLPHGSRDKRLLECGLDAESMAETIRRMMHS